MQSGEQDLKIMIHQGKYADKPLHNSCYGGKLTTFSIPNSSNPQSSSDSSSGSGTSNPSSRPSPSSSTSSPSPTTSVSCTAVYGSDHQYGIGGWEFNAEDDRSLHSTTTTACEIRPCIGSPFTYFGSTSFTPRNTQLFLPVSIIHRMVKQDGLEWVGGTFGL